VRRELRTALKEYGLPIKGKFLDETYGCPGEILVITNFKIGGLFLLQAEAGTGLSWGRLVASRPHAACRGRKAS
jgi:hypothetical protein